MAIQILIGGLDKSPLMGSLNVTTGLGAQATCDMDYIETGGWMPEVGAPVEVRVNGSTRYLGSVDSVPRQVRQGGVVSDISVASVDITSIAGRCLAGQYTWSAVRAGQIFRDIVQTGLIGEGISTDFVEDGPIVDAFETNYEPVAEALNRLCETTGMVWRMTWDRQARFHSPDAFEAPISIVDGAALVRNLKITADRSAYANRVLVRLGQAVIPDIVETITGAGRVGVDSDVNVRLDGAAKAWDVSYRIVEAPVVKLDGVALTVAEDGAAVAQCYWTKGSQRVALDGGMTAPGSGSTLEIKYTGIAERLVQRQNDFAVAERAGVEGGTGVYAIAKTLSDPITEADAGTYAQALVDTLSQISRVAEFEVDTFRNPLAATLEVGQKIYISIGGYASPGWYLIRRVAISDMKTAQGTFLRMRVEAANGPVVGDALSWFRQLMGQAGPSAGLSAGAIDTTPPSAGGTGITPPSQPAASDWSLEPREYRADANGNQFVNVRVNYTGALPANADYLVFWIFQAADRPGDPAQWVDSFHLSAPGINGTWLPQPRAVEDWVICCTAVRAEYSALPAADVPIKTISVVAWKAALPFSDFGMTATPIAGAILQGEYTASGTLPDDPNRMTVRIYRRWCLAGWTTPQEWQIMFGWPDLPTTQTEPFWDWPEDEWLEIEARTVNHAGDETPCTPIVQLHLSGGGLLNGSKIDPVTLDSTLALKTVLGVKKLAIADGGVGKTQIAPSYDLPEIVSGIPSTLGSHSKLIYNSLDGKIYRWNAAHLAYERVVDGADIKAELAYNKLTSAEFAASIEPVGIVSSVPGTKTAATIYNTSDGKTYRWSGSAYVRDTNATEIKSMLAVDQLTAGQIAAGAIGTTQLSTAEILIGAGGGKCGRFRINDGFGTMIGFMGDDGAGFVGMWASRGRFGGTFASPIVDLSTAGALIDGAELSLTKNGITTAINNALDSGGSYGGVKVGLASGNRRSVIGYSMVQVLGDSNASNGLLGIDISNQPLVALTYPGSAALTLAAGSSANSIQSGRTGSNIYFSGYGSYIKFNGGGGYIDIGEYRAGGQVVIDSSRNLHWPNIYSESIPLGGITATKWVPCFDAAGSYQGKIPIIP